MALSVATGPQQQVVFLKVSWATYEAIVSDLDEERSGARLAYDGETLEIMAPVMNDHESSASLLELLLTSVMDEWDINLFCSRSATLKTKQVAAEPDTSYYIEHAGQVDGLEKIDLNTSPPPDLVVEVDISHQRMDKFALYAKLGVPEFWRYRTPVLKAFTLKEGAYREIAIGAVIPGLPLAVLGAFLERRLETNRRRVLRDWQTWLRANRPPQE